MRFLISKGPSRRRKIHFYHLALIILSIFYNTHGVNTRKNNLLGFYSLFLRFFVPVDHLKLNGFSSVQFINCDEKKFVKSMNNLQDEQSLLFDRVFGKSQ